MLVPQRKGSYEARHKIEELAYKKLSKTRLIIVLEGFVTFFRHFEYLGTWISISLRDDHDVSKRLSASNALMVAMSKIWDDNQVDTY